MTTASCICEAELDPRFRGDDGRSVSHALRYSAQTHPVVACNARGHTLFKKFRLMSGRRGIAATAA